MKLDIKGRMVNGQKRTKFLRCLIIEILQLSILCKRYVAFFIPFNQNYCEMGGMQDGKNVYEYDDDDVYGPYDG